MTERQLVTKITKYVKDNYKNIFWYKIPDIPAASTKKPFDVVGVYKGKPFGIEFKKPKGKIEDHQIENIQLIINAGGHATIMTLSDSMVDNKEKINNFLRGL